MNRHSKDRGSVSTMSPDQSLNQWPKSPTDIGSDDDYGKGMSSVHSTSILSKMSGLLPVLHFETSDGHAVGRKYDIQSKSAQSNAPSMLQIWGGADQIPASKPAAGGEGDTWPSSGVRRRPSSQSVLGGQDQGGGQNPGGQAQSRTMAGSRRLSTNATEALLDAHNSGPS